MAKSSENPRRVNSTTKFEDKLISFLEKLSFIAELFIALIS